MKTVLFVHGGKVAGEAPAAHFLQRLEAAAEYYRQHQGEEDIIFLVSGRWTSVTETFTLTEAEIGKRWILGHYPAASVIKEDISVELIGNIAFSKPLIGALQADQTVIFTSDHVLPRLRAITQKILADDCNYELVTITHDLSDNVDIVEREARATQLFEVLFTGIAPGDDVAIRDRLLYSTPYYFKGIIDDKVFFDQYWQGGFEHHAKSRALRNQLG